jgi:hypothetical protein
VPDVVPTLTDVLAVYEMESAGWFAAVAAPAGSGSDAALIGCVAGKFPIVSDGAVPRLNVGVAPKAGSVPPSVTLLPRFTVGGDAKAGNVPDNPTEPATV